MPIRCSKGGEWWTLCATTVVLFLFLLIPQTHASLKIVAPRQPTDVFGGAAREITVTFHNPDEGVSSFPVRGIVHQTTSSSAIPVATVSEKDVECGPGATVVETFTTGFPEVQTPTLFVIQWIAGDAVLGISKIEVFPKQEPAFLKEEIGVFDPAGSLRDGFGSLGGRIHDLDSSGWDAFRGDVAIVTGTTDSRRSNRSLKPEVMRLAHRGVHVLWLTPPPQFAVSVRPSFFTTQTGQGNITVADTALVDSLATSPRTQHTLQALINHTRNPKTFPLPE